MYLTTRLMRLWLNHNTLTCLLQETDFPHFAINELSLLVTNNLLFWTWLFWPLNSESTTLFALLLYRVACVPPPPPTIHFFSQQQVVNVSTCSWKPYTMCALYRAAASTHCEGNVSTNFIKHKPRWGWREGSETSALFHLFLQSNWGHAPAPICSSQLCINPVP